MVSGLLAGAALASGCGEKSEQGAEPAVTAAAPEARPHPNRLGIEAPRGAWPIVWVRRGREVELRRRPSSDDEVVAELGRETEYGSPTVLGVVKEKNGWAGVTTELLPNGVLGWVRLDRRELRAGWTTSEIAVDLSERRAELRRRGRVVREFAVTVGAPGYETPQGRFAVTDTFRGDLNPAYGCCALALSATQPDVPSGWLGGNRIAIHGTLGELGIAASHGCVRAADSDVSALVNRVPLGTPVFIRP